VREGALCRAVGGEAAVGQAPHGRGDVDDGALAALEQRRRRQLRERVGGQHVELERRDHRLRRRVEEGARHAPAGVVHDHVEPAELAGGGIDEGAEVGLVVDVAGHDDGAAAEPLDLRRHLVELLLGASGEHHVGPCLGEGEGDGGPDPPAAPGHDGRPVRQREALEHHGPDRS
jgi:hypothetical protein